MRNRRTKTYMIIIASIMIFAMLLVSILLGAIIVWILFRTGVLNSVNGIDTMIGFIVLSGVSLVLGTVLTSLYTSQLLNSFSILSFGMHRLSEGYFDTRIQLRSLVARRSFEEIANHFNSMAQKLGENEILRRNFISDFSHEFKTPIVSLRGFAKILKNKNLSETERDEYLDIIISEADNLTTLSKNVLALSKIENQVILNEATSFDLTEQVRSAIILLQNKWSNKNQQLDIDLEEMDIVGNAELLAHCWINLIDNAIKFTPEKGIIRISLKENENSIKFVVSDNGCGMNERTRLRIFDKFYQGDTSHATEGNGIGLTLVFQIIRLHHGLITCESKENVGTTFTITLPKNVEEINGQSIRKEKKN